MCLSWLNFLLKVHSSHCPSQTTRLHTNLLKFLAHILFYFFFNSRFFLRLPETSTIRTVCLIWVRLKVKCPPFHRRRPTHRSRIKESKEKVAESKRKVDQRKVKNPLSKRPDPSKSGGVQEEEEEEGDDGKQGWLEE